MTKAALNKLWLDKISELSLDEQLAMAFPKRLGFLSASQLPRLPDKLDKESGALRIMRASLGTDPSDA